MLEDTTDMHLKSPGDWNQPHTRFLVSPPELALPTGGFLTLDFPQNLVVWEVLPDNSERQIISGVTQIATDRDSLFYAYGMEKSGAERDTEVELTLNNVAPQPTVLDKVKVTIVDAFYEVNVTTFIPFELVDRNSFLIPTAAPDRVFEGDDRGFDRTADSFRTRQLLIVTPFVEFDTDGILGENDSVEEKIGETVEYDKETSVDPNDPTKLLPEAKAEEQIEANKGAPLQNRLEQGRRGNAVDFCDSFEPGSSQS